MGGGSGGPSLGHAVAGFLHGGNTPLLIAWLSAAVVVRVVIGEWSAVDLVVAVVLLAAQPFAEWGAHRFLMHGNAMRIGTRDLQPPMRAEHLRHHRDRDAVHFMPLPVVVLVIAVFSAVPALLARPPLAATAVVVLAFELLAYVWIHYLLHSGYEPVGRWLRGQRAAHLRHHAAAERSFGVVTPIADIVLRTR